MNMIRGMSNLSSKQIHQNETSLLVVCRVAETSQPQVLYNFRQQLRDWQEQHQHINMSRYDSALEWMRVRAMNEHKDVGDFWRVWGASADKHFKHTEGTVDYKQYKAENELFKIICKSY